MITQGPPELVPSEILAHPRTLFPPRHVGPVSA